MAIEIQPIPPFASDTFTLPEPPDGFGWAWTNVRDAWANMTQDDFINSHVIDFVFPGVPDYAMIDGALQNVQGGFEAFGQRLAAVGFMRGPEVEAVFPDQICVGDFCVGNPFGGGSVGIVTQYRLYIGTVDIPPSPSALSYRPFIWPPFWVAVLLAISAVATLYFIGIYTGRVPVSSLDKFTQDAMGIGSRQLGAAGAAMSWPMFALGFTVVAAGIFIPIAVAKADARVNLPGGIGNVGGGMELCK